MNLEALKKLFTVHNVPVDIQDFISEAEGIEDDYNFDEALNSHKAERLEVFKANYEKDHRKAVEDELNGSIFAKINSSLINTIKKYGDFTKEELEKVKDAKDAVKLLDTKYQSKIASASEDGVEEWQNTVNQLKDKLEAEQTSHKTLRETMEEKIAKANQAAEAEKKAWKVDTKFKEFFYDTERVKLDKEPSKYEKYMKMLYKENGYVLDLNEKGELVPKMADGTRAMSLDGNSFIDTVDQLTRAIAEKEDIWQVSNGGKGQPGVRVSSDTTKIAGKEINREASNTLAESLGINISDYQ